MTVQLREKIAGNKELEYLIESEYSSLCAISTRLVGRNDVAEDIVQSCFVSFWEKRATYGNAESKKGLLYVMVRNESLNHLRSIKREKVRNDVFVSENMDDSDENLFGLLLKEEIGVRLDFAIDQLPPQTQKIIKMSLTGLKNKDIGLTLGISVNSVKTLKYSAIKKIREFLLDKYGE